MSREVSAVVQVLRRQGYVVQQRKRSGHWCVATPQGPVFFPSSPSDWRWRQKIRADLRRHGIEL